jgi:hypothetical protein
MPQRLTRYAPLTGALFAIVTIVAFFSGGETPNSNASPAKVVSYYATHRSKIETTSVLFAIAFLFAVFWAGALFSYLRRNGGSEGLAALVLAGGVLMSVGAATLSGVEYGLAHNLYHLSPQTAQTLNVLSNQLFLPLVIGGCVFAISAGLAIVQGAALPRWLGWVALVLGVLTAIPPVGFFALLVFVVWSLVVSILIFVRSGQAETVGAVPAPAM